MTADLDNIGVDVQFALWGYALTGDMLETSALVAEGHAELVRGMGAWDHPIGWFDASAVSHGDEPYRPPRPWSALPWLAEHALRGHMEWPGL